MKDINFNEIPILSRLDRVNMARLIPNFERLRFDPGKTVFTHGEAGDSLCIIV